MTRKRYPILTLLLALSVAIAPAVHAADPYTRAKRELEKAKKNLSNARKDLKNAGKAYKKIEKALAGARTARNKAVKQANKEAAKLRKLYKDLEKATAKVGNVQGAINNIKREIASVKNRLGELHRLKTQAENGFNQAMAHLRQMRSDMLNQEVVLMESSTKATLTLNAYTGQYFANLDLGFGMSFDSSHLENLMQGQLTMPNMEIEDLVFSNNPYFKMRRSSNYTDVRDTFFRRNSGKANYFASERFVEWVSPESLAEEIAMGVVTAGSSVNGSLKKAQEQISLEFGDMMTWAKTSILQGAQDAVVNEVLSCAMKSMLQQNCQMPSMAMTAGVETVMFDYDATPKFATGLALDALGFGGQVTYVGVTSPHMGFHVSMDMPIAPNYQQAINDFGRRVFQGQNALMDTFNVARSAALSGSLTSQAQNILSALDGQAVVNKAKTAVSELILDRLGLDEHALINAYTGSPLLDLRNTVVGENLKHIFKPYLLGNDTKVVLKRVDFDVRSYAFTAELELKHRLTMPSVHEAYRRVQSWMNRRHGVSIGAEIDKWVYDNGLARDARNAVEQARAKIKPLEDKLRKVKKQVSALEAKLKPFLDKLPKVKAAASKIQKSINASKKAHERFISAYNKYKAKVEKELKKLEKARKAYKKLEKTVNKWKKEVSKWVDKVNSLGGAVPGGIINPGGIGLPW